MSSTPKESSLTSLSLLHILRPLARGASQELTEALCNLRLDEVAQRRYDELASKNTEGTLTDGERQELSDFVALNDFVSTLKAEAMLAKSRPAAA
jgi:hypothetical protein